MGVRDTPPRHAMNLLDQRLRHNDRGPCDPAYRISIEPLWQEGKTLRATAFQRDTTILQNA